MKRRTNGALAGFGFLVSGLVLSAQAVEANVPDQGKKWAVCDGGDTSYSVEIRLLGRAHSTRDQVQKIPAKLILQQDLEDGVGRTEYFGDLSLRGNGTSMVGSMIAGKGKTPEPVMGGVYPNAIYLSVDGSSAVLAIDGNVEAKTCIFAR